MANFDNQVLRKYTEAHQLQAADILLVHTKRSLWGWIIRFGTHCYWNHALMVCSAGDVEKGYDETLIEYFRLNQKLHSQILWLQ